MPQGAGEGDGVSDEEEDDGRLKAFVGGGSSDSYQGFKEGGGSHRCSPPSPIFTGYSSVLSLGCPRDSFDEAVISERLLCRGGASR